MVKKVFLLAVIVCLAILVAHTWSASDSAAMAPASPEPPTWVQATGPNLLTNGDFNTGGFYFRMPNSLVAWGWFRWDVTRPDGPNPIPEFIDGGTAHHNQCYPEPAPGESCADMTPKNHSQGYIKYGGPYIAGVWQPVQVTACQLYQFAGYVRTDASGYRPKVGIDPTGWQMPRKSNPDPGLDYVCPPTGHSECPREHFSYESDMPASIVWSAPYAYDPPLTWRGPLSVTTEALSTTITVWTFAAPSNAGSQSTYWDLMSLVQVPPANGKLIADGTLPAPDGSIGYVVTQTTALRATLNWKTSQPALTQVLYHYVGDANMPSPPPIGTQVSNYESSTAIGSSLATDHQARLPNLRPVSLYDYVILARKLVGNSCQTSVYTGRLSTTDMLVPQGALPAPSSDIIGLTILPFEHSAYMIWQSAQPSYAQVLYHDNTPLTSTATLTYQVFLPIVSVAPIQDSTLNYEFHTLPITTFTTLHVVQLTGLLSDTSYSAVAVSAWTDGDQDKVAVSARTEFRTGYMPTLANISSPAQLAEQLQACLAGGKRLEACAGDLR